VPEEILAGVSDLEVWELVRSRQRSALRLLPSLHAKYFRFDNRALVGSANLTARALGWSPQSNLELLVDQEFKSLRPFEAHVLANSFEVDAAAYSAMVSATTSLESINQGTPMPGMLDAGAFDIPWFPKSLQAQRLFSCYQGRHDQVIASVFADAALDLTQMRVPAGLDEKVFNAFVAARLQQLPVVAQVDSLAVRGVNREDGAAIVASEQRLGPGEELHAWDTLAAWLLHFMPTRYRMKTTLTGPVLDRSQLL
jgi:hypothetical protein